MNILKTKLAMAAVLGLTLAPVAQANETPAAGYYYPPAYYNSNSSFFDDGRFSSDSYGKGRGSARGEAEFSMSISGKGKTEQSREAAFGGSSYGGNSNRYYYPYWTPYGAPNTLQR